MPIIQTFKQLRLINAQQLQNGFFQRGQFQTVSRDYCLQIRKSKNKKYNYQKRMGGCQSTENTEVPGLAPVQLQNKFKLLQKRTFNLPTQLHAHLQSVTSNGKITDYICQLPQHAIALKYQELNVGSHLDSGNKFIDKQFPANEKSIGPQKIPQTVQWKKADQIFKGEYYIFEGKIQPSDIKQGKLGDCYFLSALTSISQFPFIIKRIFEATQISTYGYYGVWLFIDGLWQCIVLDDNFPCHNAKPFFSRNNSNELWVMLLEKAYAKVFGSYQAIESGLTGIALSTFTGAPYQYLCKDSNQKIDIEVAWAFLTQHISQNHLVCGSTENNDRNQYLGLVSTHAYTVLDIQQVYIQTKKGKKKERILKLSNPWGRYEWKGRWSEYSDVWSEQLREQLNFQKADDGMFWIGIDDFVENFGQICACNYNKNYVSTSLPIEFSQDENNSYKGVFLSSKTRSEGYLSLIQTDHRKFPNTTYQYSPARLIVLKIDKSTKQLTQYMNDIFDCDHDATIKLTLDQGDYYVFVQIDWKCNFSRQVVLNFYGQHFVGMVEDEETFQMSNFFNEVVLLHEKYTEKERVYHYAKDEKILRITGSIAGYVYYHYNNKSIQNNYLCENVSLREKKFIEVYGQKEKDEFTVKVYPEQQRIVTLKVNKEGNGFYSFSTKIQFYIVQKYSLEKLRELADKKPTKVKKREIEGKEIDVRVKTYNYSGGIVLLYQNKMDKYAYIEEISFELENLQLENETLSRHNKLEIQLEPQTEKLLSFVVSSPGKEVVFRTKMSFYLNSPEFKF